MQSIKWLAPSLVHIRQIRVKVNGSGKHCSLLRYCNNYGSKKFYSIGTPFVGSQPCPQILDLVKANGSGKHCSLLRYRNNYGRKNVLQYWHSIQMVGSQPCPQSLYYGESEWKWQTLQLITIPQQLWQKKALKHRPKWNWHCLYFLGNKQSLLQLQEAEMFLDCCYAVCCHAQCCYSDCCFFLTVVIQ